jgi:predicted O-methyltransferase YrrM
VSSITGRPIDLLLLDGLPKETLQYLKAAEPHLAPGAMIIADNAGECVISLVCEAAG